MLTTPQVPDGRHLSRDGVLLGAACAALAWANLWPAAYGQVWLRWTLPLPWSGLRLSAQDWVNQGLLTFFFLLIGLELSRELRSGHLRQWRQASVPVVAGLTGMALPAALYALVLHGGPGRAGWGIPMATDVALALAGLGLVSGRAAGHGRLRAFLLALAVTDDIASLVILVGFYHHTLRLVPLLVALAGLAAMVAMRARWGPRRGAILALGVLAWWGLASGGGQPAVIGVALGLLLAGRPQATGADPTSGPSSEPNVAKQPGAGGKTSPAHRPGPTEPNSRLERRLQPWVGYLVLPLFALANLGIALDAPGDRSAQALAVFGAVVLARVLGKPLGILAGIAAVQRLPSGRFRLALPLREQLGVGALAGIGFTVPVLIVRAAFGPGPLADAAIAGLLATSLLSLALAWGLLRRHGLAARRARK